MCDYHSFDNRESKYSNKKDVERLLFMQYISINPIFTNCISTANESTNSNNKGIKFKNYSKNVSNSSFFRFMLSIFHCIANLL